MTLDNSEVTTLENMEAMNHAKRNLMIEYGKDVLSDNARVLPRVSQDDSDYRHYFV